MRGLVRTVPAGLVTSGSVSTGSGGVVSTRMEYLRQTTLVTHILKPIHKRFGPSCKLSVRSASVMEFNGFHWAVAKFGGFGAGFRKMAMLAEGDASNSSVAVV